MLRSISKPVPIIILWSILAICPFSYGQLVINSIQLNTTLISPSTLFHTILSNPGSNTRFWLEGDLVDSKGEPVLSFQTVPLDIATGTRTYQASDLAMRAYRYGTSETARSTQLFQRLPNGTYTFCLKLRSDNEGEDRLCENEIVDEFLMLDLVHPWNRDTIEETRPTLTWSLSSSGAPTSDARLVVSPLPTDRTPAQAMAAERPHFLVPNVSPGPIPYPAGLPDLERGKCYAWQVEVVDGNRVKDRSEPWGFCVSKNDPVEPLKYVKIKDLAPGSIYHVVDGKIYFRYDEQYASTTLTCQIFDRSGVSRIASPVSEEERQSTPNRSGTPRSVGVNLYELDITSSQLKPGIYTLVISDEKGHHSPLQFQVSR